MRKVGIDRNGALFYLDTGEYATIDFSETTPYDVYTGEDVQIVVMDAGSGIVEDISDDIKDALIAIFGNANQIRPAPTVPASVRTTAVITPRETVYQQAPQQESGGLFGGEIKIKAEYALLIVGGLILFSLGKNKGR
jgi:hypothetical protein